MLEKMTIQSECRQFPILDKFQTFKKKMPKAFQSYKPFFMRVYGAICVNNLGKILLVRGRQSQKWSFPKGHCEKHETAEICARRELYEETGLVIRSNYTSVHKLFGGEYFVFAVEGEPDVFPHDCNEIVEVRWWPMASIPSLETNIDLSIFRTVIKDLYAQDMDVEDYMDSNEGRRRIATIKRKITQSDPANVPFSTIAT